MYIQELNPLAYKLAMGKLRTGLSDNCLLIDQIQIFGCFSERDEPLGFAMYHMDQEGCDISNLTAQSNEAMEALVEAVKERCRQNDLRTVYWTTDFDKPPSGFICTRSDYVYRVDKSFAPYWQQVKAKFSPIADRYAARGYSTVPLNEDIKREILEIYKEDHDSQYMDDLLRGDYGTPLTGISAAVLKDGHVVAYCVITADESCASDCRLGYLGCSKNCRSSFVAAAAFIRSVDAYFQSDYRSLRFIINEQNIYSGNLVKNQMSQLKPRLITRIYRCDL